MDESQRIEIPSCRSLSWWSSYSRVNMIRFRVRTVLTNAGSSSLIEQTCSPGLRSCAFDDLPRDSIKFCLILVRSVAFAVERA